jgi:excisionase family DNA binding protein
MNPPSPPLTPLTRENVLDGRAVAELLHLPISTVLEYARRGLIPAHKLGRRWVFIRDEVEAAVRAAPSTSGRSRAHRDPTGTRPAGKAAPQLSLPVEGGA